MKLSIITINFNSADSTQMTIKSLREVLSSAEYSYEIIVIDNDSAIEDYKKLESLEGIRLIRNNINGGFAAANNIGFRAARGEYIMILNNDATVKEDIFTSMINFMESDRHIGAISPTIVYDREPYTVQYGGYRQADKYLFDIQSPQHGRELCQVSTQPQECAFAHGAAMMISKEALESVNREMREDYFLYFEEIDFSIQIVKAGYQIWHFPKAVVYHNASATVAQISHNKIYYNSRNRLFLATNNLKGGIKTRAVLIQLLFSFPKSVAKFLIKGKGAQAAAYTSGVCAFLRGKRGKR